MGIKRTPADDAFSKCVRERNDWTCERCGTYYPDGPGRRGLHCSHYHGRRNFSVRFDISNCFSLCYGCHRHFTAQPEEHKKWVRDRLGEGRLELLSERKRDTNIGRFVKRSLKDVAAHYRKEYERMRELRADGVTGRIEFTSFI